ncbi:hypothetical protein J3F82_006893, partial [Coemansia sp. RSA 637]
VVIVSQAKSTAQPGSTALPLSTDGSAWSQVSANSLAVRQAPEDHSSLVFNLTHSSTNQLGEARVAVL